MSAEVIRMFMLPRGSGRGKQREKPCPLVRLFGESSKRRSYEIYRRASYLDEHADTTDLAEKLYHEAIRLDPVNALAMTNLGNIHFRRGDADGATEWFEQALTVDPRQPEALYNRGYQYALAGFHQEAIKYYRSSLAADPSFADAWFNLGMSFNELGKDCSEAFRRYVELEPEGTWAEIARRYLRPKT